MTETVLKTNDLVWAKLRGNPFWPGIIVDAPTNMPAMPSRDKSKGRYYCVLLFGSREYKWCSDIKPYDSLTKSSIKKKAKGFNDACKEIEKFIATKDVNLIKPKIDLNTPKPSTAIDEDIKPNINDMRVEHFAKPSTFRDGLTNKKIKTEPAETKTDSIPDSLPEKKIKKEAESIPISPLIGFIGVGIMGTGIVKNLLNSEYKVSIWVRNIEKVDPYIREKAKLAPTARALTESVDVLFVCLPGEKSVSEVFNGEEGVLSGVTNKKTNIVMMTTINPCLSTEIQGEVTKRSGRYMVCFLQGNKEKAESGSLNLCCACDKFLYDELELVLKRFCIQLRYIGENVRPAYIRQCALMTISATSISMIYDDLMKELSRAGCNDKFEFDLSSPQFNLRRETDPEDSSICDEYKPLYEGMMRFQSIAKQNSCKIPAITTVVERYNRTTDYVDPNTNISELAQPSEDPR